MNRSSSNGSNNIQQRFRRKAIGVEKFSSSNKKSSEIHRAKKEKKFRRNATLLRQYQKAMKQEGYNVGKGASRRRRKGDNDDLKEREESGDASIIDETSKSQRNHKTNSFSQAKKKAQNNLKDKEENVEFQKRKKKEKEAKILQRRKRGKVMGKRTTKGQPVMKNVISNMLEKLQNDAKK